jgi:hypothetical protein
VVHFISRLSCLGDVNALHDGLLCIGIFTYRHKFAGTIGGIFAHGDAENADGLPLADTWRVYDNSNTSGPLLVASGARERPPEIYHADIWSSICEAVR